MSKTDQTDQKNPLKELIEESLDELLKIYCKTASPPASGSRIIFPVKRDGSVRVSEQEARFLFVKHLEAEKEQVYHYSVETPTSDTYRFTGLSAPVLADDGRSASIDVCLYEKTDTDYQRKHNVEFKAHNVDIFSILKDFLKLRYDNDGESMTNYFVHIIETADNSTIVSLKKKYKSAFAFQDTDFEESHPVKKNEINKIIVCLCFLDRSDTSGKPQILFMDENDYQSKLEKLIN